MKTLKSQSPQIGAAVLPERGLVELRVSDECRNPLKSGLLSYRYSLPGRECGGMYSRNPLKSGLLSYRMRRRMGGKEMTLSQSPQIGAAVLPECGTEIVRRTCSVAIPSNRGCCPTLFVDELTTAPAAVSQSPQIGAAVLPSTSWPSRRSAMICRNPLKSGLLSYHESYLQQMRCIVQCRNPLKSGLLSYLLAGTLVRALAPVAIPSNRGCCPTHITRWLSMAQDKSQSPQIGAAVLPLSPKLA